VHGCLLFNVNDDYASHLKGTLIQFYAFIKCTCFYNKYIICIWIITTRWFFDLYFEFSWINSLVWSWITAFEFPFTSYGVNIEKGSCSKNLTEPPFLILLWYSPLLIMDGPKWFLSMACQLHAWSSTSIHAAE